METPLVLSLVDFFFVIKSIKNVFVSLKYVLVFILAIPQVWLGVVMLQPKQKQICIP